MKALESWILGAKARWISNGGGGFELWKGVRAMVLGAIQQEGINGKTY
ncbi:MAG: hypothetical protein LBT59_18565 [Clostridiales bacterium]|nr:hypothetical protein [Clostridiales bacterium]